MDNNSWTSVLLIVLQLMLYISGKEIKPENVAIYIMEGNVTVTWKPPQSEPFDWLYQVQLSDYLTSTAWRTVSQCNHIKTTTCNIGIVLDNIQFQARVGILMPENKISWSKTKLINIKKSHLSPPSFNLALTSNSVQVRIQNKTELYRVFPFGLQYTAYLWPHGQENQTLITRTDDGELKFNSLQTWHVYCVRVKVESKTTDARNSSSVRCIQLPLDMTVIISFGFLGVLGIASLFMLFVCFLRRPGKMPAALKPVVNGWRPMIVGLDKVEVVTDKGWLLITNKTEIKRQTSEDKSTGTEEEKERRESLDSGVSMESSPPSGPHARADGQIADPQVDSGCGSLKGTEGSGSVGAANPEQILSPDKRICVDRTERGEDSGLGLGPHAVSGCLDREDIGLLPGVEVGGGYRSQSPASVDTLNESAEHSEMDTNMAAPSCGYRSAQVTCMCSDHEYCDWCRFRKPVNCQSGTQAQTNFSQSRSDNDAGSCGISNYLKKSLIQTVNVIGLVKDTKSVFPQADTNGTECSALLLACPLLLQYEENQNFTTDALSFTLDDVELASSGSACV